MTQTVDMSGLERSAFDALLPHVGRTIAELAVELHMPPSAAKHYTSLVMHRILKRAWQEKGGSDERLKLLERELSMHIVPISADGRIKEALSFPAFRYRDLLQENWETSDLRLRLARLFIVPIRQPYADAPVRDWRLQQPFFWSPGQAVLDGIHTEWEQFRTEIASGRAQHLSPASKTKYIHVRPKARNASDTDDAPVVGATVKKCFWLNQRFIAQVLTEH
jgi:DNA mismatch repair protein MutH